jgi:hypothetical protein
MNYGRQIMQQNIRRVPNEPNAFLREYGNVASGYRTLPYSLIVHSYSNLSFRASILQSGFDPGAKITMHASLAESGMPTLPGTHVWAEITKPDGSHINVAFDEDDGAQFSASLTTTISGIYRCRVRARGRTRAGYPFQREQTLIAAVWQGGDRDADPNNKNGGPLVSWLQGQDEKICRLLRCILSEGGVITPKFGKLLLEMGLDVKHLRRCLKSCCDSKSNNET